MGGSWLTDAVDSRWLHVPEDSPKDLNNTVSTPLLRLSASPRCRYQVDYGADRVGCPTRAAPVLDTGLTTAARLRDAGFSSLEGYLIGDELWARAGTGAYTEVRVGRDFPE